MTSSSDTTGTPLSDVVTRFGRWFWNRPLVLAVLVIGVIWYASSGSTGTSGNTDLIRSATPVVVAPVYQDSLDIYLFGLGAVTPLNVVNVRSRVSGQLMAIAFKDGQIVKAGDLLAQIDPVPFEVQLKIASGQLVRDRALLDNAQIDLDRYNTLLAQDSISTQQVDTQKSLIRQYKAALQADKEVAKNAKLQLAYARIVAPISGRVGFRQVSPGNIVSTADAKGIVTITQLNPISVVFPIPEDELPRVMKLISTGNHISVDVYDRALKKKLGQGYLLATDNQIDASTGTIKLKAELPNTDGALFANQFVNVRMSVDTQVNAILIPTVAIQRGALGTFVYVVQEDQTVVVTAVKIGVTQGEITAIEEGVVAGDIVVVDGVDKLRDGAKIKVIVRDTPEDMSEAELDNNTKISHSSPSEPNQRASGST